MGYGVPDRCPPPSGSPLLSSWSPPVSNVVTTTTINPNILALSLPGSGEACPDPNTQIPTSGCTAYDISLDSNNGPVDLDPFYVTYTECTSGREITIIVSPGSCYRIFAQNGTTPSSDPNEVLTPDGDDGGWRRRRVIIDPVPCEVGPPLPPVTLPPTTTTTTLPPSGTPTTTTTTTTAAPSPEPPLPPAPDVPQEFTYQTRILTLGEGTLSDEEVFLDNYNGRSGDDRWYQRSFEPQMYYLFNSYQFDADNTDYSKAIDSHWIYNWLGRAYAKGSDGGTIKPLYLDNMTVDENVNTNLPAPPHNIFTYTDKKTEDLAIDINYNLKGTMLNPPNYNNGGLIIESYDDTRTAGNKLKYYFIGTVWGHSTTDLISRFNNLDSLDGVHATTSDFYEEGYQRVALDSIPSSIVNIYNSVTDTQTFNIMTPINYNNRSRILSVDDSLNWTSRCYGFDPHSRSVIGSQFGTPQFSVDADGTKKSPRTYTQPVLSHYAVAYSRQKLASQGTHLTLHRDDGVPVYVNLATVLNQLANDESLLVDHQFLSYTSNAEANRNRHTTFWSSYSRCKMRLYAIASDGSIDRDITDSVPSEFSKRCTPDSHARASFAYLSDSLFPELTDSGPTVCFGDAFDTGDIFNVSLTFPAGHPSGIPPVTIRNAVLSKGFSESVAASASGNYYTITTLVSSTRDATMIASGCVPIPPIKNWMLIDYINDMRTDYE